VGCTFFSSAKQIYLNIYETFFTDAYARQLPIHGRDWLHCILEWGIGGFCANFDPTD
jgi:hypothetical protein